MTWGHFSLNNNDQGSLFYVGSRFFARGHFTSRWGHNIIMTGVIKFMIGDHLSLKNNECYSLGVTFFVTPA